MIHKFLFLLLSLFIVVRSEGQIKGNVFNMNITPIENATIYLIKNNQDTLLTTFSDKKGNFIFNHKNENNELSLLITHIGYESLVTKLKFDEIYFLATKNYSLEAIEIQSMSRNKKFIDVFTGCGTNICFGDELATYIPSTEKNLNRKITSLKYQLEDMLGVKNNKYLPFRACIYTVDSITKKPDKKIFRSEKVSMRKNKKWFKVDVDSLNIHMPKEGLFIVIEALTSEEYNNLQVQSKLGIVDATPTIKCKALTFKEITPSFYLWNNRIGFKDDPWRLLEGQYYMEFEFEK